MYSMRIHRNYNQHYFIYSTLLYSKKYYFFKYYNSFSLYSDYHVQKYCCSSLYIIYLYVLYIPIIMYRNSSLSLYTIYLYVIQIFNLRMHQVTDQKSVKFAQLYYQ